MRANDFLSQRTQQLHAFFSVRFGRGWREILRKRFGVEVWSRRPFIRLERAENLAAQLGFRFMPPCWQLQPSERNFTARLSRILDEVNSSAFVFGGPSLGEVLQQFFQYRQSHRPPACDIIGAESLTIASRERRTPNPLLRYDSSLDRLLVMSADPLPESRCTDRGAIPGPDSLSAPRAD